AVLYTPEWKERAASRTSAQPCSLRAPAHMPPVSRASAASFLCASGAFADHLHLGPGYQRIGGIYNQLLAGAQSGNHLDRGAIVPSDLDGNQLGVVVANHRHLQPLRTEEKRIGWDRECTDLRWQFQMDEDIRTGQKLAGRIIHIDFR